MAKFVISDLSFCEIATPENIKVAGGFNFSTLTNLNPGSLFGYLDIFFEPVSSTEVDDFVVTKLENNSNNESGIIVSSKDGKSLSGLIVGHNYKSAFSSSFYYS
ncbi:hypothetical protein RIVM261_081850 [Rivularia sp. IAM M-261]|nr:hypothetical protein CAL7716_098280 [Calothrix sp. PCC 7716]GJD23229.1 hypothetical protein RIVM261_081850 [Rivularia sp. IAM M-261]